MVAQRFLQHSIRCRYAIDDSELVEKLQLQHDLIGTRLSSVA